MAGGNQLSSSLTFYIGLHHVLKKKISACTSFSTIILTTMYYWSYFAAEEIGAQRNSVSWRRSQLISRRTKKRSSLGSISHTNGHCCKALGLGKMHLILAFPTPTPTSPIFLTELADSNPKNRLKCVQCSAGTELENVETRSLSSKLIYLPKHPFTQKSAPGGNKMGDQKARSSFTNGNTTD